MSLPGPGLVQWGLELLLLVGVVTAAGEGIRRTLATSLPWFRFTELLEGLLVDLYLGGALLYVIAVLPIGAFLPPTVLIALAVAIAVGVAGRWRSHGGLAARGAFRSGVATLQRPAYLFVLLATGVLFVVELASINQVPTGNTFDSSVDTTFVALLNLHGSAPFTLGPIANGVTAYPQGTTAIFSFAQSAAGLPAARVPLLVTPLFLSLGPLGGFAIGRRWLGTENAAVACALFLAFVGPGTRYLAYGSNDFALAFPLVLLLAARSAEWVGEAPPALRDAVAFGAMVGYSAALNPVGAEWLFVMLPITAVLVHPRFAAHPRQWTTRWAAAAVTASVWVIPSLVAVLGGAGRSVPGGPETVTGISSAQFLGWTDPLVFGSGHFGFAPVLGLQFELALLLVLGCALLVLNESAGDRSGAHFGRWAAAAILSAVLWISVPLLGGAGVPGASALSRIGSAGETSLLLFTVFALLGAYPLIWFAARLPPAQLHSPLVRWRNASTRGGLPPLSMVVAALVLLPGAVATAAFLPGENASLYHDFSRVSDADFALLNWAPDHLPSGARVLVAPGSAAEFLPAYDASLAIVFPMTGASWTSNESYLDLRSNLVNGTLGASGVHDLTVLGVQYIAITGNDTDLFAPFSPAPFLGNPLSPAVYSSGGDYVFRWTG